MSLCPTSDGKLVWLRSSISCEQNRIRSNHFLSKSYFTRPVSGRHRYLGTSYSPPLLGNLSQPTVTSKLLVTSTNYKVTCGGVHFCADTIPALLPFRSFWSRNGPVIFYKKGAEVSEWTGIIPVKTGTIPVNTIPILVLYKMTGT